MKKVKKDSDTISNEWHELVNVAEKFGIKPSQVLQAKEHTGSNDRIIVENYIRENFINKSNGESTGAADPA